MVWGLEACTAVITVEKRIDQISLKIEYDNFPRQVLWDWMWEALCLGNGYVKQLDPEGLILKDNITLFNISIL